MKKKNYVLLWYNEKNMMVHKSHMVKLGPEQ